VEESRIKNEVILKGEDITLSFGGITALLGVSFQVKRGEIFSIMVLEKVVFIMSLMDFINLKRVKLFLRIKKLLI